MDNYCARNLAAAIVMQAYNDYKACVRIHKHYPEGSEIRKKAEEQMKEIMDFASGDWYRDLTDIPSWNSNDEGGILVAGSSSGTENRKARSEYRVL